VLYQGKSRRIEAFGSGSCLVFRQRDIVSSPSERADSYAPLTITFGMMNQSVEPAPYAFIEAYIDSRLELQVERVVRRREEVVEVAGTQYRVVTLQNSLGQTERIPLFMDPKLMLFREPIKLHVPPRMHPSLSKRYLIGWQVFDPRMEGQERRG
jgi:hypothetical protein